LKEELKNLLTTRGLSYYRLSKMTGIREGSFYGLRSGNTKRLSFEHVEQIADALEISLDEFRIHDLEAKSTNQAFLVFQESRAMSQE